MFDNIADNRIASTVADSAKVQFSSLLEYNLGTSTAKHFDESSERLDTFWNDLIGNLANYSSLFELVKRILIFMEKLLLRVSMKDCLLRIYIEAF
jgi:hypothetical protein